MWLWMLDDSFDARRYAPQHEPRINGLYHARNKGLHEAIQVAAIQDAYSDHYTDMYGSPVWSPLPAAKDYPANQEQEADYKQLLQGTRVLDSLQPIVNALRDAWP